MRRRASIRLAAALGCAWLFASVGCEYVASVGGPGAHGPSRSTAGEPTARPAAGELDDAAALATVRAERDPPGTALRLGRRDQVDVLFVVGNTPGAAARQERLAAALPGLVDALGADRNRPHFHIGVVTSDLGAGPVPDGTCRPGGDGGALVTVGADAPADCRAPLGGVRYIDYDTATGRSNLPAGQDLAATFRCMTAVGAGGCDFPQPLEAARRALADRAGPNRWFLRPDATLAVVVLADEDDCSAAADSDVFTPWATPALGPRTSYRCARRGVVCGVLSEAPPAASTGAALDDCRAAPDPIGLHDLGRYVDFFTRPLHRGGARPDPNDVVVLPIAAPAGPFEPVGPDASCTNVFDPACSGTRLRPSCTAAGPAPMTARPAVRLAALAAATNPGATSPVCPAGEEGYDAVMTLLAGAIDRSRSTDGCLPAPLLDAAHPRCQVTDTIHDDVDGEGAVTELPRCDQGTTGSCWRIVGDPGCAPIFDPATDRAERRRLLIERASPVAPSTTTAARCATR